MGEFRQGGGRSFGGSRGGGFSGGRGGFGGGRGGFGGRGGDRGPVTMTKAICDECKKPCEVPFRPTAGKPVYCNNCFGSKKEVGSERGGGFPRKTFGSGDYKTPARTDFGNDIKKVSGEEIKKQIEVLNGKIDRLTKVIEVLTNNKPVVEEKVEKTKKVAKVKKVSKK